MQRQRIRTIVVGAAAEVLAVPATDVPDHLVDLPQFSSFRCVELVEALERDLRIEFAAEDLVPGVLTSVDGLVGLCERHLRPERVSTGG